MRKICILFCILFSAAFSEAGSISYTDKLGRKVHIPVPVEKAVFFETYELIPCLDIWDRIAAIGRYAYRNDLMTAAMPDIEQRIPCAGSGSDINTEVLLKVRPDIVITWAYRPEAVRFIEEKGLNIIALYPESLEELYDAIRLLGEIFDRKTKADAVIAEMDKLFSIIREKSAGIAHDQKRKVLWLGGKSTIVSCGVGINNNLIQMIGGINPAGDINQRSVAVSVEQIVMWNPDVVFIWGNAGYSAQDILSNLQWRHVSAVKEGKVFKAPVWSTWSPRLAPVALWMAKKTWPEYYRDTDMDKLTDAFYQKVFHIPYAKVKGFED